MANKKNTIKPEELVFYGRKLGLLREKANISKKEMAELLNVTPPVITKLEQGLVKDIESYAKAYAIHLKYLGFDKEPELNPNSSKYKKETAELFNTRLCDFLELYMHISTYAVPDTNALETNPKLIEELLQKYTKVIVPDIIITELENRKKYRTLLQEKEIAKAVSMISENQQVITVETDRHFFGNHDDRIIEASKQAVKYYNCHIHIITDDKGFKAKQKINSDITILRLSEFLQERYAIENMIGLCKIDSASDNYFKAEGVNLNAYLPNGRTLITSTIVNKSLSVEQKIKKIRWLCENGADINKREASGNYFPPLTIIIQQKDVKNYKKLFDLVLDELKANPNAGSRNPYSLKMIRQQNEGNMPLMVAARSGLTEYVKKLCEHPDIILNQQDSNGFTALIKTAYHLKELKDKYGKVNGYMRYKECCEMLIDAGIDYRILDVDGNNAAYYFEYINDYIERIKK